MSRPSWDEYFMQVARVSAYRATCDRKHVGAVVARDNHILSTGYNGSPPGHPHCDDVGHDLHVVDGRESCFRTTHAEVNAISVAARFGVCLDGATLYVTMKPCVQCAKAVVTAGIKRVVYDEDYGGVAGVEVLLASGCQVMQLKASEEDGYAAT